VPGKKKKTRISRGCEEKGEQEKVDLKRLRGKKGEEKRIFKKGGKQKGGGARGGGSPFKPVAVRRRTQRLLESLEGHSPM